MGVWKIVPFAVMLMVVHQVVVASTGPAQPLKKNVIVAEERESQQQVLRLIENLQEEVNLLREDFLKENINDVESQINATVSTLLKGSRRAKRSAEYAGSVYIRWGREACPLSSNLVYRGLAGGSHHTHSGGGSNYLCLPYDPIYSDPQSGDSEVRGTIYSVEYESNYPPISHLTNHDVPCAVCEAERRPLLLMMPARNICHPGWTTEYFGYLMSERYSHYRTEFVCVDKYATPRSNTSGNSYSSEMFPVEGRCSPNEGLPCGPYISGYEFTCAVCTK